MPASKESDNSTPTEHWLGKFANLNVSPDQGDGKGVAPNKPLLLFAVMEMVESRALTSPVITWSAELLFRFQNYWPIVQPRRGTKGDMRLPFHALGSVYDRVWRTLTAFGQKSTARGMTEQVVMDDDLWMLMQSSLFRSQARRILIATYFPADEQVALSAAMSLQVPDTAEIAALKVSASAFKKSQEFGRSTKFRGQVVSGYFFTCAMTGYCLTTSTGAFIVEAAHIRPLSERGSNDPKNGLALTPNAHWMFDEGLWTVDEQRKIVVAGNAGFKDLPSADGFTLRKIHGQPLQLDPRALLSPDPANLAYHRDEVFVG